MRDRIILMDAEPVRKPWIPWRHFAFAPGLALVLLAISTLGIMQPAVTRGSSFYAWKQAIEKAEVALVFSVNQQVNTHLRLADRRGAETERIVDRSPDLAWMIGTAQAHEGEIHLESEEAQNLVLTVRDMQREISVAVEIAEKKITQPKELDLALEKIEKTSERRVRSLRGLQARTTKNAHAIVKIFADTEDERLFVITDARDKLSKKKNYGHAESPSQ